MKPTPSFTRWCGCLSARFCLKHAVNANTAGKTVLVFGGFALLATDSLRAETRAIGALDMTAMLFGQLFYTSYWSVESGGGVDAFFDGNVRVSQPHTHVLTRFLRPWVVTFSAAIFYSVFCGLFLWISIVEPQRFAAAYAAASAFWHGWIAVLMLFSTFFSCLTSYGQLTPSEHPSIHHRMSITENALTSIPPHIEIPVDSSMKITSALELREVLARHHQR